ncbi:MAG: hypothetical protein AAGA85_00725 [Bacteroidota bacterium]
MKKTTTYLKGIIITMMCSVFLVSCGDDFDEIETEFFAVRSAPADGGGTETPEQKLPTLKVNLFKELLEEAEDDDESDDDDEEDDDD